MPEAGMILQLIHPLNPMVGCHLVARDSYIGERSPERVISLFFRNLYVNRPREQRVPFVDDLFQIFVKSSSGLFRYSRYIRFSYRVKRHIQVDGFDFVWFQFE